MASIIYHDSSNVAVQKWTKSLNNKTQRLTTYDTCHGPMEVRVTTPLPKKIVLITDLPEPLGTGLLWPPVYFLFPSFAGELQVQVLQEALNSIEPSVMADPELATMLQLEDEPPEEPEVEETDESEELDLPSGSEEYESEEEEDLDEL